MSQGALDLFGHLLMTKVRDEAISDWEKIADGKMKGERASRFRQVLASLSEAQRQIFLSLVPEVVDTVLHHLLWTLDQRKDVMVRVQTGDEDIPDLKSVSDGLAGELYSDEGWIARFSR